MSETTVCPRALAARLRAIPIGEGAWAHLCYVIDRDRDAASRMLDELAEARQRIAELEAEANQAKERETYLLRKLDVLTPYCSDHGCVFGKPKGMGTNGGCHCLSEVREPYARVELRRKIGLLVQERDAAYQSGLDAGLKGAEGSRE